MFIGNEEGGRPEMELEGVRAGSLERDRPRHMVNRAQENPRSQKPRRGMGVKERPGDLLGWASVLIFRLIAPVHRTIFSA